MQKFEITPTLFSLQWGMNVLAGGEELWGKKKKLKGECRGFLLKPCFCDTIY